MKEFDSSYEKALKEAESYFGKEYPNLIAGEVIERSFSNSSDTFL